MYMYNILFILYNYNFTKTIFSICLICIWPSVFIAPTAPPENFIIIVINSTALKLQWDLPPEEHRNGIIIAYTLSCEEMISDEYLLVSSPDFPLIVTENGPVSLILNGFRPGTAFNCAVSASNLAVRQLLMKNVRM